MPSAIVLGWSGFIGRNIVRGLQSRGWAVTTPLRAFDLAESTGAQQALAGHPVDYVFHAADVSGTVEWSKKHAGDQFIANGRMTMNVLDAWQVQQPTARFVGFSSLWAYPEELSPCTESMYWDGRMIADVEHYGAVKKLLGAGISAFKRQRGMRGTVLVLGNVYGPDDTSDRVIPSLVRRMRACPDRLELATTGHELRDFVFIDDQVTQIVRHADDNSDLRNATTGRPASVREVVETLARLMDYQGEIIFGAKTVSSRITTVADPPALVTTLEDGLRRTLDGLRR